MRYSIRVLDSVAPEHEARVEQVRRICPDAEIIEGKNIEVHFFEEADALRGIKALAAEYGRDRAILFSEDGWECMETDLLPEEAITERYRELFAQENKDEQDHESPDLHDPRTGLILASSSPRRREYLRLTGIPFTSCAADLDEDGLTQTADKILAGQPFGIKAALTVMYLAEKKARHLWNQHPKATVLGSDTLVAIDGMFLGKPTSRADAFDMLKRLSGRDHHVFTGVSIVSADRTDTFFTSTRVRFFPWSERMHKLTQEYIDSGSPLDKAGAYGIQDEGALLVSMIRGDYYTVVGLPVSRVAERLADFF